MFPSQSVCVSITVCMFFHWTEVFPHRQATAFSSANVLCPKLLQLRLTLCDSMDYNPLGFSVHWILQGIILGGDCHALL